MNSESGFLKKPQQKISTALVILGMVLSVIPVKPGLLSAQTPILVSYQRNFVRADLVSKAGILQDAATDERAPDFIGELYEFALGFALENAELFRDDPDMIALTGLASKGAGAVGHRASVDTLWKVFTVYQDSRSRVEVLGSLAVLAKENPQITENLNQFLADQNAAYRSGIAPDYPVLSALIGALPSLGKDTSFSVLFAAATAGYPGAITQGALDALNSIPGNYRQYLMDVIWKNPPAEKLTAFRAGVNNEKFSIPERGELAETALEVTLDLFPGNAESRTAALALRYGAVRALAQLRWTRAASLMIKHFYRVQTDYGNGEASKEQLLEAINCLGSMESSEAAQVLALRLGFFNSRMERNGEFDEALILALINALGEIGDKAAFDYLLYIGYLPYPESLQAAAKEALNRLKW